MKSIIAATLVLALITPALPVSCKLPVTLILIVARSIDVKPVEPVTVRTPPPPLVSFTSVTVIATFFVAISVPSLTATVTS